MANKDKRRLMNEQGGDTTYLGEGVRFVGNFSGNGELIIRGEVEGDCDLNGPLTLARGGSWKGRIKATRVVVGGTIQGDVIATERLEIAATAKIDGSARGRAITIAEGAIVQGEVGISGKSDLIVFHEKRQNET
ncbi:MAG: polymer-forming cytoskeletal protein [Gammaproteobacteria bacterium]